MTLDLAKWLGLAATPTFAVMALLTNVQAAGPMGAMCAPGPGSLAGGMVPMYLLMSAFHASPWLRLIFSPARPATAGAAPGPSAPPARP
jgi:hypothetical protein